MAFGANLAVNNGIQNFPTASDQSANGTWNNPLLTPALGVNEVAQNDFQCFGTGSNQSSTATSNTFSSAAIPAIDAAIAKLDAERNAWHAWKDMPRPRPSGNSQASPQWQVQNQGPSTQAAAYVSSDEVPSQANHLKRQESQPRWAALVRRVLRCQQMRMATTSLLFSFPT